MEGEHSLRGGEASAQEDEGLDAASEADRGRAIPRGGSHL